MKTLILCDQESTRYDGADLRSHVQAAAREMGSEADVVVLNGDKIAPCLGCFLCWVKTPGLCVMTSDGINRIAGQEARANVVVFLSKIVYGGYSYDVKSFLDRSIQNLSPYFEIVQDEMLHEMRYEQFPIMIILGYGVCTSQERQTFVDLAKRNALNMRSLKHFVFTLQNADEIESAMQWLREAFKETRRFVK